MCVSECIFDCVCACVRTHTSLRASERRVIPFEPFRFTYIYFSVLLPNISYARIRSVTLPFDFLYHSNLYRSVRLPSLSVLNITDLPTRRVVSRSSSSFNPISSLLRSSSSNSFFLIPSLERTFPDHSLFYSLLPLSHTMDDIIDGLAVSFGFGNVVFSRSFGLVFYLEALFCFGTHSHT